MNATADSSRTEAPLVGSSESVSGDHLPRKAAVVGAGLMGTGIALILATGIEEVGVTSRTQASLDHSRRRVERYARELEQHGLLPIAAEQALARLRYTTLLEDAVGEAAFVEESIVEDAAAKRALYERLDDLLPPPTILSSNTSALPIAEFAGTVRHPERIIISHFVQPAHVVPALDVVRGSQTSQATVDRTIGLWRALGRMPLLMQRDEPGFLINRLQHALVREAVRLLAEGLATAEDIDAAVQYGLAPRFITAGPLKQRDVNGLAMHIKVAGRLWPELDTPDGAATALEYLRHIVDAGGLGLENGRGFYDWSGRD
ncbi:MAG TPA: 3-hydroxyacyl-CoA dehydrogenase NAD-binding domain-containing protein, partial [Chloroflexota bacterium]|nr:3-hydroxyacyl-CoA dehydrogenase NAD-binding domain-containing protein [Chloroflexota bacterium]